VLWQRYSKNKLKAIHNQIRYFTLCRFAVAKVFKEQIESNSQPALIAELVQQGCGKGIQRTN